MKPMLFNSDMVRAILAGRKTVTRRVVKPQPYSTQDAAQRGGKPPCRPGDILYVRETFFKYAGEYVYRASAEQPELWNGMWRPSIHMPKEAARLFLRVTDVRAERLQDMNMADVKAEGVVPNSVKGGQWQHWQHDYMKPVWDSTVKPEGRAVYGWEANPWVWVIAFERCEKPEVIV